jgi:Transposase IS116/IS110/IS902 family
MAKNTRFVGLDVHAETIAVAVAEGRGQVRALGTIPNRPEAVRRLLGKVGKPSELRVCYEAGPTGYALYWQALRGVAQETAVTVALEFGSFSRFERAPQAMGYTGLVSSEYTSGSKKRQGAITKTGNSHLRRALVEAAWHYRHRPRLNQRQKQLQGELAPKVAEIAWAAQERLTAVTGR